MTAGSYTAPLAPPPRRLRTNSARQGQSIQNDLPLPAYVCGFGRGTGRPRGMNRSGVSGREGTARRAQTARRPYEPAERGAQPGRAKGYPAGRKAEKPQQTRVQAAQTVCRPYEPQRPLRRRGEPVPHSTAYLRQAARRRAARRAKRAQRRLAALLLLAGLFTGVLALRGLSPGLIKSHSADPAQGAAAGATPAGGDALTLMLQQPALPNGCETVSLAMLLDWAGCPADPVELFGGYIPHQAFQYAGNERYGPDPEAAYAGDAASARGGWYCFEGPVVQGANAYLSAYGSGRQARAVTGLDKAELEGYLDAGTPLAVWVTRGYEPLRTGSFSWVLPDGSRYIPCTNLHCVVLAGRQENGQYRIADPLDGWQTVDPDAFWQSFDEMGRRAVVIE